MDLETLTGIAYFETVPGTSTIHYNPESEVVLELPQKEDSEDIRVIHNQVTANGEILVY